MLSATHKSKRYSYFIHYSYTSFKAYLLRFSSCWPYFRTQRRCWIQIQWKKHFLRLIATVNVPTVFYMSPTPVYRYWAREHSRRRRWRYVTGEKILLQARRSVYDELLLTCAISRLTYSVLHLILFRREYDRQTEHNNNEWQTMLHDDRGIWALEGLGHSWVLDETEGPCRVRYVARITFLMLVYSLWHRKKMQRKFESSASLVIGNQDRVVLEPDTDAQSFVQVEMIIPPWSEGFEFHPTHGRRFIWAV